MRIPGWRVATTAYPTAKIRCNDKPPYERVRELARHDA
jgi:hypothetical protein